MKRAALLLFLVPGVSHAADALTCLADNIYYEAGHEPFAGQVAVAQVTLNRMAHTGRDLCAVVYDKRINAAGKKVAAFSWTLGRAWRAPGAKDPTVYAQCMVVARRVIYGGLRSIIGPTVLFYHATYVHPVWHKHFVVRIGGHLFYRG